MYVCSRCNAIFEEYEVETSTHYDDNLLSGCMDETVIKCPECGSRRIEEATECSVCGVWFDNDGLHGVCECCLEKHETVGEALDFGDCQRESVEINGFIANVLSVEQINNILTKWVEENFVDHSKPVKDFLYADKSAYSEYLEDKYGE